jgi:hypothetical protein
VVCIVALVIAASGWALAGAAQAAGPAAAVNLSLSPTSIVANGTSTTTATVSVTDSSGAGLPGEPVVLSSSDPNERMGALTDADGTYTATITSSTTLGGGDDQGDRRCPIHDPDTHADRGACREGGGDAESVLDHR